MLSTDKQYARAILLSIKYPDLNDLGISILQGDKNALITITDKAGLSNPMYVNTFYSYLANPLTIGPTQIQDTFTVENVSSNYTINIRALVIYVKTTTSPNDHTC